MCTRWFIISDREIRPPADSRVSSAPSQDIAAESWSYLLPYVTLTEDIWGNMGHVLSTLWVGFFCLVFLRIFPHVCFAVRFYAHRHRPDGDAAQQSRTRTMEPRRGPGAGWGSSLCCWVVILPLVEMTAQSTALLALVTNGGGTKPDQVCALKNNITNREENIWRFNHVCWENVSVYEI